jgi:hypothetical protein
MANYIVTSARLAGFKLGDIVTDSDLDGSSIEALIESRSSIHADRQKIC